MNTTPLTDIAPEIFRKRLLVEGYFAVAVTEDSLRDYFSRITSELGPTIIYTCGEFDEDKAVRFVKEFFRLSNFQSAIF